MKSLALLGLALLSLPVAPASQAVHTAADLPSVWDARFGAPGASSSVQATAVYDDGSGSKLYAVGFFEAVSSVESALIARWNGARWEAIETPWEPKNNNLYDICVYDDGTGPKLYVAGRISVGGQPHLAAEWDGSTWRLFGLGPFTTPRQAWCLFADQESLYIGGKFNSIGGIVAKNLARFDGTSWFPVGTGRPFTVRAIQGTSALGSPRVYIGTLTGGYPDTDTLSYWNGSSWIAVPGVNEHVYALAERETAGGTELLAGGEFKLSRVTAGGLVPLDDAAPRSVYSIAPRLENEGSVIYAGGPFTSTGGTTLNHVTRWDGTDWTPLGSGSAGTSGTVWDLAWENVDGTERLYATGYFDSAGDTSADNIAAWDGTDWSTLGEGQGLNGWVRGFEIFDDGSGPRLYVGGWFRTTQDASLTNLARRIKGGWEALPAPPTGQLGSVRTLKSWDGGSGPALFIGSDTVLWRFDGTNWTDLAPPRQGWTFAMETWDDGSGEALFVGGLGTGLQRWDGTSWQDMGVTRSGAPGIVNALAVWDDGTGEKLYVAGEFDTVGGTSADHIASWDGVQWSALGAGLPGTHSLLLLPFDIPSLGGPGLAVGGSIKQAPGYLDVDGLVMWNGTTWIDMPSPQASDLNYPRALTLMDDGEGVTMFAAGLWDNGLADVIVWRGTRWRIHATAGNGTADALFPDLRNPDRPSLWVGGSFESIAGLGASGVTRHYPAPVRFTPVGGSAAIIGDDAAPSARLKGSFHAEGGSVCIELVGASERIDGLLVFTPADAPASRRDLTHSIGVPFTFSPESETPAFSAALPTLDDLGPTQVRALWLDEGLSLRSTQPLRLDFEGWPLD